MKIIRKIIISILIFIVITTLCIIGFYIYKIKNNEQFKIKNNESSNQTTADIIKTLFMTKLKEINNNSTEQLLDYRIDKIKILSDSEKELFNQDGDYSPSDILALVTYSVKPKNIEKTFWIAGNGEISGEWIINKTSCECLRNGKLNNSSEFSTAF